MPATRPLAHAAIGASLALSLTACDVPDRAVSPPRVQDRAHLEASAQSAVAQTQGYRKAVTAAAIRVHQSAFQNIADNNGGQRSSLGAAHDATIDYIRGQLTPGGYATSVQPFSFTYGGDLAVPEFGRVSPNPHVFVAGADFQTMTYSGSGNVTAPIRNVDLLIPSNGFSTSGCEAADFAGFPTGAIALVQRGTCSFQIKAINALAAGASAVIVMNEGNIPERTGVVGGTLGAPPPTVPIPVIGTTYAIGVELAGMSSPVVRIKTVVAMGSASSSNLIAETPGGDPENVVVVAASPDARFGPGINAASGAAAMIELARVFAAQERSPRNRLRFLWLGAYPEGQEGATHYVSQLSDAERARIRAVIDVQALGSPNFGRFVVDGDQIPGVAADPKVDAGSAAIEAMFKDYFDAVGLSFGSTTAVQNAGVFRGAGIPFGGVHSGYATPKSPAEAAMFGGTAGADFDPCYWLACDTFANTSLTALDQLSDANAHVVLLLSKRNFAQNPLAPK